MLAACDAPAVPLATTPEPTLPTATVPPASQAVTPTAAPTVDATGPISLVVWMDDEFAQMPTIAGVPTLTSTVASFLALNPNTRVTILPKKPSGKGGIEDQLISTQAALPQAVPDLVTLDLDELPRIVKEGVLQPFDPQFSPTLQADLYPLARQAGQSGGRIYAVPFSSDVLHLVYDSSLLKVPPLNWTELYSTGARYAVAAGGDNGIVGDSFLVQYLALGGRFVDARGRPSLDRTPLRDTLEFYHAALQSTLVPNVLALKSVDDAWQLFLTGKAALVDSGAHAYLRDRGQVRNIGYGAIPTRDGSLVTIGHTWGFALTSADVTRRAAAQRFVETLVSADANASWNRAANRLPVRKQAIVAWSGDFAYRDFVNQLLTVAVNRPGATSGNTIEIVLQSALQDVLAGNLSASDAADKALAALARLP
jgi:ABC-type glycerol-3-phosphate transport system substrate-binding protein